MTDGRVDWRWLDRISHIDAANTRLVAHRRVLATDWYFAHHFENFPVVPGVFLLEMMVHAAVFLQSLRCREATSSWSHYFLAGANNTRFYRHVLPDSDLQLVATTCQGDEDQSLLQTEASVDGRRVAKSEVLLQRVDVEAEWITRQDKVLLSRMREVLPDELRMRYKVHP